MADNDLGFIPLEDERKKDDDLGFVPLDDKDLGFIPLSEVPSQRPKKSSPLIFSRPTTKADVAKIAAKYNVDVDELYNLVPHLGGQRPASDRQPGELLKEGAAFLGESVGMGLPQFAIKKSYDNPAMRQAIDELREVINENESWAHEVAEWGISMLAPGGLAGKAAQKLGAKAAGVAAAQIAGTTAAGAVGAVAESTEGTEASSAAIGAGLGAAVGTAASALSRKIENWLAKKAKDTTTEFSKVASSQDIVANDIAGKALQKTELEKLDNDMRFTFMLSKDDSALHSVYNHFAKNSKYENNKQLITSDLENELRAFARALGGQDDSVQQARSYLETLAKTRGERFLKTQYNEFRLVENAKAALNEKVVHKINKVNPDFVDTTKYFFSASRYVFRDIDKRLGTWTELTMDKMNKAYNEYQSTIYNVSKDIVNIDKFIKKTKQNPEEILRNIEKGNIQPNTAEDVLSTAFQTWGEKAEKMGLPIKRIAGGRYVPHYTVDPIEAISRITKKSMELGETLESLTDPKSFKIAVETNQELKDLVNSVALITNKSSSDITSLTAYKEAFTEMMNLSRSGEVEELLASSILQRKDVTIPNLIRETDPLRLMNRWTQSVFRYAYLREGLTQIKSARDIAIAANDTLSANYLTKYLQDMSMGVRQGTLAAAVRKYSNAWRLAFLDKLQETPPGFKRSVYEALERMPGFGTHVLNNVYANFLGFSARAIVTNMTTPFTMTASEIGFKEGLPAAVRAISQAAKTKALGETITIKNEAVARALNKKIGETATVRNLSLILENEGLIPKQWNTELVAALEKGIATSLPVKVSKNVVDSYTKLAMFLYQASEAANRYVARNMADDVTNKLLSGQGKTIAEKIAGSSMKQFFNELSPAYKRAILRARNETEVRDVLRQYLIGKTVFDYNRISMSEYGRTMGPLFSMFTKWPTEILGDVINLTSNKQYMKMASKYLGPFAVLSTLDLITHEYEDKPELEKMIVGKSGYSNMAPLMSMKNIAEGQVFEQPAVTAIADPIITLLTIGTEPERFGKTINKLFMTFGYGAGLIRAIEEYTEADVPLVGKDKDK